MLYQLSKHVEPGACQAYRVVITLLTHCVEEMAGAGKEVARRWQGGTCLSPASPNDTEAERKLLLLLFAIAWHHLDNVVTQT